jgi:hypothetical protein
MICRNPAFSPAGKAGVHLEVAVATEDALYVSILVCTVSWPHGSESLHIIYQHPVFLLVIFLIEVNITMRPSAGG